MKKSILLCACLALLAFSLTACGSDNHPETTGTTTAGSTEKASENGSSDRGTGTGSVGKDAENIVEDAGDAVDDAAKDIADGISGVFDTFDHASKYFLDQIPSGSSNYEVRNSDKDLTDYNNGSMGYHIELHDTRKSSDSKVGDFYVDSTTGKIYKASDDGKSVREYDFSDLK